MRIQITAGGIYGADGEIPVGAELTLDNEPTGWAGRYAILSGGNADDKVAVINPSAAEPQAVALTAEDLEAMTVVELKQLADDNDIDLQGATLKADIIAAIQLAAEPKA